MSYRSLGLASRSAVGGWAQVAECVADGGTWDGYKCVKLGSPSMQERACKASGGSWDSVDQLCYSPGTDSGNGSGETSTTTGGGGGSGGSSTPRSQISWGQIGVAAAVLVGAGWWLKTRSKKR
ncbi:MAG: hypothetical protein JRD89_02525 [Deltaproteobacteria bacterium]|nr:hypothetical protein [Deltaproteobacteria bacterium]